jgi:hypothetical protein
MRLPERVRSRRAAAELFAVANLTFLAGDIFLAHAINAFSRWEEWIPFVFSLATGPLLLAAFFMEGVSAPAGRRAARLLGIAIGGAAIAVGVAGLLLHLDSAFFARQTLKNLVYTAPFAAPLAYAGLGLLVLLDRLVDEGTEWACWVILLALGGFAGNVALSLADHAQNGFFRRTEWIPVAAAAFAVGFLGRAIFVPGDRRFAGLCLALMAAEAGVGVLGFVLHLRANLANPGRSYWDRFLYGAPIFAPLLFANLAILAAIGLSALASTRPSEP